MREVDLFLHLNLKASLRETLFQFGITEGGDTMKYGSILKACRERAGFNQEELAFRLNINQSDVSKYENDVKEPNISVFHDWTTNTQAMEVLVAFLCGVDGLTIMTEILGVVSTVVTGFINFFY